MFTLKTSSLPLRSIIFTVLGIHLVVTVVGITVVLKFVWSKPITWQECQTMKTQKTGCCILRNHTIEMYGKEHFLCCTGEIHRRGPGLDCCQHGDSWGSVYRKDRQTCCEGRLYDVRDDVNFDCCNNELFNKNSQLCCQDNSFMKKQYKILEIQPDHPSCPHYYCNGSHYNSIEQVCCNDQLLSTKVNHSCCGDSLYNVNTEICCEDRKYKKDGGSHKCCGQLRMSENEKCCGKKIIKKDMECCGNEKVYNSSVSKCTGNAKVVPIETPLCANLEYDPEKELCCGSFALTKRKPRDNMCCKPRGHKQGTTINNQTMRCEDGKVYSTVRCGREHTKDRYTCCNGFAYEQPTENSVCCNGRAEWYSKKELDKEFCRLPLCDNEWYDDKVYDCCNDKLINPQKFRCINKKAYRYFNRADRFLSDLRNCSIYAISKSYNCCAGLMPYKSSRYTCPFREFERETPIKSRKFPFWAIIKCRSERKTGKIVDVVENGGRVKVTLKTRKNNKIFTFEISNKQLWRIKELKHHKAYINVYYEKSVKNELFLGVYGAIERKYRRRENIHNKGICERIDAFFRSGFI